MVHLLEHAATLNAYHRHSILVKAGMGSLESNPVATAAQNLKAAGIQTVRPSGPCTSLGQVNAEWRQPVRAPLP